MKLFSTFLRRKRGIILFVAAFLFPLIFVVVAGIDTFSKRQKATKNLLESNLWLSGRSALEQLEVRFVALESAWLNEEYFSNLQKDNNPKVVDVSPLTFILDANFQIVLPKTVEDKNPFSLQLSVAKNSDYEKYMELAGTAEFTGQKYLNAVKNYQKSLALAKTSKQEALAIEGLARSNLAVQDYRQAARYYQLLRNKYNQIENMSGHPYGITAPLQLYTLGKLIGEEVFDQDSILITYQMLRDKHWIISPSIYFFFKSEYESILNIVTDSKHSRFEKELKFIAFLDNFVIPSLKERSGFSDYNQTDAPKRTFIQTGEARFLVCFKEKLVSDNGRFYYTGICWNQDSLISSFIVPVLAEMEAKTGLEFWLVSGDKTNILTGETTQIPEESLSLSFGTIPFPWSLLAIQPGYEKLETDAKTQGIIYGLLVVIIILLMLFAVVVLLRDISRETDSMLLQTEFVHNVSHELKTPLSLIRLYGETLLIKENLPEADRKNGLQIITKESERLSYMINNILDFSKIEMGRKEFDLQPGKLAEVVTNTLDSYRYHFLKKGFKVEEEIDQNIPMVSFDKNALEGILINLFSNVIKFSNVEKKMRVSLQQSSKDICLEVTDKGIGMPSNELSNIFNRFYRVKGSTDFEARGSGLGLTLVKHAVDAHDWQIDVKSTFGQGSSFSILIPKNQKRSQNE